VVKQDFVETTGSDSEESDKEDFESEQDPPEPSTNPDMDLGGTVSPQLQVENTIIPNTSLKPAKDDLRKFPPPSQMVLRPRKNQTVTFQD
jgi:hypothetical protein